MDKYTVKTYICTNAPTCRFSWQFSAEVDSPHDLSPAQLHEYFGGARYAGLQAGECPSCHLRGTSGSLVLEQDSTRMSVVSVPTDAEIAAMKREKRKPDGSTEMEEVGSRDEVGIVNGQVAVVKRPIRMPAERLLTDDEIEQVKVGRVRVKDELTRITVTSNNVSEPPRN